MMHMDCKLTLPVPTVLGRLDAFAPTVVVDSREQTPLMFTRLPAVTARLTTGDYSLVGAEHLFSDAGKKMPITSSCTTVVPLNSA